jgi:hypothetical protein
MPVINMLDQADLLNYAVKCGFDYVTLPYSIRKKDV